jgi:hypothetical protein
MEAVRTYETSVYYNETTRRNIPEGYPSLCSPPWELELSLYLPVYNLTMLKLIIVLTLLTRMRLSKASLFYNTQDMQCHSCLHSTKLTIPRAHLVRYKYCVIA